MSTVGRAVVTLVILLVLGLAPGLTASGRQAGSAQPARPVILTLRQQAGVYNGWLKTRLDRILPELMRQGGFDMWLVICRENNNSSRSNRPWALGFHRRSSA